MDTAVLEEYISSPGTREDEARQDGQSTSDCRNRTSKLQIREVISAPLVGWINRLSYLGTHCNQPIHVNDQTQEIPIFSPALHS